MKGSGVAFVFQMKDGGTGEGRILADFENILIGHNARPGTRIQFFRNYILHETVVSEDLSIRVLSGPGMTAGLVRDHDKEAGYLFAVSVSGGVDLVFRQAPVSVYVGLSADLGAHLTVRNRYDNTMTFYQNGIRRAWYPEVSVKYRF